MIWTVLAVAVVLFAPLGIIFLTKKVKFLGIVGAVALCYVLGLLLAVSGLPYDKSLTTTLSEITVPVAIPLILFSLKLGTAKTLAKKSLLSFVLVCASVVIVATSAFFVANPLIDNAAQLAAMTSGLYTGGTPNLNAIGLAMGLDANVIAMANTSDLIVGGVYFLFLLTAAKPVYAFLLDRRKKKAAAQEQTEVVNADDTAKSYAAEYTLLKLDKRGVGRLVLIILLAIGCLGVSAGAALLATGTLDVSIVMLGVSALGVAFSFVKPVRETKGTFQAGHYIILMFSLSLSMSIDLSVLVQSILPVLLFMACVQTCVILVHLVLCRIFRIDSQTAIITSTAGVYGPAFIPPMTEVLDNQNLMIPGLVCGILGYAIGNFLGIGLGNLFLLF